MHPLAVGKVALAAGPAHRLRAVGLQVHLDARIGLVEKSHVLPARGREVGAQQGVGVQQQVAVEGRRHAQRIVVGGLQDGLVFHPVDADQDAAARPARSAHGVRLTQQGQRLGGGEVADAGAGVEHADRRGAEVVPRQPVGGGGRQGQLRREIHAQPQHGYPAVALPQLAHGLAQVVHRNVHRHIGARPQDGEQPRGLGAAARAQIDQHRARRHLLRHGGAVLAEDGGFGARGVVLGQLGDGVEQARAQRVVEELGRDARRRLIQPRGQLGLHGRQVFAVDLHKMGGGCVDGHAWWFPFRPGYTGWTVSAVG